MSNRGALPELGVSLRFVVSTVMTMMNVVFWDIKPQFIPHRRHYGSATAQPVNTM
jgi:hypothetical protein